MKVGFHVSIQGSIDKAVDRAIELGCDVFQIFTRSPRQWKARVIASEEVQAFTEKANRAGMKPVFGHTPYLVNLASPKDEVHRKSLRTLVDELGRCGRLGIPFLVTHLGSHCGAGVQFGLERIVEAVNRALEGSTGEVTLLLENTAGTKNSTGDSFEKLQYIIEHSSNPKRIGVCFDTCHAFAAGYDLRTPNAVQKTVAAVDETVGFEKLGVVHLNDSVGSLDCGVDRHEHIGLGGIGEEGFRAVLASKLGSLPLILETPRDARRSDVENLRKVRELTRKRPRA